MRRSIPHLTILGGGPAGLAVGYFAKKKGLPFSIYEGSSGVGGHCTTYQHGEFFFDSGAHRFHDKFPDITNEIKQLMGADLQAIDAPSQIYDHNEFIDFPLSPLNLLRRMGLFHSLKAGAKLLQSRLHRKPTANTFESFAVHKYGRVLADRFLLNYSEKLWGSPSHQLSPAISGSRMKGLGLKTFLIEAIHGHKAKVEHLDGIFYYPKRGYGTICDELARSCGWRNVLCNSKITKIFHNDKRFNAIEINGMEIVNIETLVSTLPLPLFISMMDPPAPEAISQAARSLRFRNLILAIFFINRPSITRNASIYFPETEYCFTRIYEPKNRSEFMSPPDKTSLAVEIPCSVNESLWGCGDEDLIDVLFSKLKNIFNLTPTELIDSKVIRLHNAYPVLEVGFEETIATITGYLRQFPNLKVSGRAGMFAYTHLHDMMQAGRAMVFECLQDSSIDSYPNINVMAGI